MKSPAILLFVFFILTLGFVIAWEGHRKQIRTPITSIIGGGTLVSICGLLIHSFVSNKFAIGEILLFRSINIGSETVASGYGIILGGMLLGLVRLWILLRGRLPKTGW